MSVAYSKVHTKQAHKNVLLNITVHLLVKPLEINKISNLIFESDLMKLNDN